MGGMGKPSLPYSGLPLSWNRELINGKKVAASLLTYFSVHSP